MQGDSSKLGEDSRNSQKQHRSPVFWKKGSQKSGTFLKKSYKLTEIFENICWIRGKLKKQWKLRKEKVVVWQALHGKLV